MSRPNERHRLGLQLRPLRGRQAPGPVTLCKSQDGAACDADDATARSLDHLRRRQDPAIVAATDGNGEVDGAEVILRAREHGRQHPTRSYGRRRESGRLRYDMTKTVTFLRDRLPRHRDGERQPLRAVRRARQRGQRRRRLRCARDRGPADRAAVGVPRRSHGHRIWRLPMTRNRAGSAAVSPQSRFHAGRGDGRPDRAVRRPARHCGAVRRNPARQSHFALPHAGDRAGHRHRGPHAVQPESRAYACGAPATGRRNAIAIADLTDWTNQIAAQLPGGVGGRAYTAPNGDDARGIRCRA